MERNLRNYRNEYKKKFGSIMGNKGAFYSTDFEQVIDMVKEDYKQPNIFEVINYAMTIGFMVGYKCAKRERVK